MACIRPSSCSMQGTTTAQIIAVGWSNVPIFNQSFINTIVTVYFQYLVLFLKWHWEY